jgi:hypothetical protein
VFWTGLRQTYSAVDGMGADCPLTLVRTDIWDGLHRYGHLESWKGVVSPRLLWRKLLCSSPSRRCGKPPLASWHGGPPPYDASRASYGCDAGVQASRPILDERIGGTGCGARRREERFKAPTPERAAEAAISTGEGDNDPAAEGSGTERRVKPYLPELIGVPIPHRPVQNRGEYSPGGVRPASQTVTISLQFTS